MATLQVTVSPEDLLQIVVEMPQPELDNFTAKVLVEKARRTAATLNATEEELVAAIYAAQLPPGQRERLHALGAKAEDEKLSTNEQQELAQLVEQSEALNVVRMTKASELATLWQQPLATVVKQLGLWQSYGE